MQFNLAYEATDISEDSSPVTEPVSVSETKDYLRLAGFSGDSSSGLAMQTPLSFTMTGLFVQSALLQQPGVVVTEVQREGTGYKVVSTAPVGRQVQIDYTAGTATFELSGSAVDIDIQYGISGGAGTVDDFDFDDTLIGNQITSARQWCEARTGCSLVPKQIQVPVTNTSGSIPVPHGPVTGTITIVNSDGNAVSSADIKLRGSLFPDLVLPKLADMVLTYNAGYTNSNIPKGLKQAILAHVAACYEKRGDETADLTMAAKLCAPFIKYGAFG